MKKGKLPLILSCIGVFVLLIIGLAALMVRQDMQYKDRIYPQVYVNGVEMKGKTEEEVINYFKKDNDNLQTVAINVIYKDQQIATFSAEQLNIHSNINDISTQAYLMGRSPHIPTRIKDRFYSLTGLGSFRLETKIQYEEKPFDDFVRITEDSYNKPAKNAKFVFENGVVSTFEDDEDGLKINSPKFRKDVDKALKEIVEKPESKTIVITDQVVKPEVTLAKANKLGIEELIGEGQSNYSHSSEDRIFNVLLAASKFNGVVIPPGEEFSFNKIIGDISASTGYHQAYIIKNGRTVLGDGGGVCQVSTTLFRSALNTGLPITERHAHAYRVSYYENDSKPGYDATIFTPDVDLRFKNDTPASILIQTEVEKENNILRFRFYGKKDNRKVELSEPIVWDEAPAPPPLNQDDPTLPNGVIKQVDYAATGAKSKFHYKVTKDGKVTTEEEFFSSYRPWQAVFLVGKGP